MVDQLKKLFNGKLRNHEINQMREVLKRNIYIKTEDEFAKLLELANNWVKEINEGEVKPLNYDKSGKRIFFEGFELKFHYHQQLTAPLKIEIVKPTEKHPNFESARSNSYHLDYDDSGEICWRSQKDKECFTSENLLNDWLTDFINKF